MKPPEQIVINETAIRYTQNALSLTGETQAFEISPELVAKLAADAAETTLTLVTLQEWITEQQHITKE